MATSQAFTAQISAATPKGKAPPQLTPTGETPPGNPYAAALMELNIARKSLAIYPATHHQVQRSLDKAKAVLDQLLETVETVAIGVADVHLMVAEAVLDPNNPAFTELATALKQHGVSALKITAGVTRAELGRFLSQLGQSQQGEKPPLTAIGEDCDHLQVKLVDYSRFSLTREASIARPSTGSAGTGGKGGLWHDFTSQLLCGLEREADPAALLNAAPAMTPEALAKLLNRHEPDADTLSQSYEHIIAAHMDPKNALSRDGADTSEALDNLKRLIRELRPQLQRQFLKAALQYCAGPGTPRWAEHFLGGFSEDLVVDMIRQANDKGEEISPSLINLVQKIVTTIDDKTLAGLSPVRDDTDPKATAATSKDPALETLFDREDYETFVIKEYDQVLKGLSDSVDETQNPDEGEFPLAEHMDTMEPPHLNRQIARVLLAFMNTTASPETYSDYATKLMRLVPPLLNQGDFDLVEKIYFAFERHAKQNRRPAKAQIAAQCRQRFSVTPLLEKSITAFQRHAERHPKPPLGYFRMLGPVVVPYAMALLVKAPREEPIDGLVRLLKLHPGDALKTAERHLKKGSPKEIGNIVRLVHLSQNPGLSGALKPLIDHPEITVRRQVLEGLVSLKDPWAIVHLREWLKGSRQEQAVAIEIAGTYRTMELVPDLCAQLVRAYFRRHTVQRNIDIIVTLGKIGDPYALPILDKVAHSIWPLYPILRREMKQTVYKTLEGYPSQSCRPLVSFGLKSKNAEIRRTCVSLLRSRTT